MICEIEGCNNEAVKKITTDSGEEKNVCLSCYRDLSNDKMDRMASDISELKEGMNNLIDKLSHSEGKNETEKKGNKHSGFVKYGK
jgi:hypothetical protein